MYIQSIELRHYIRLELNNIAFFKATYAAVVQFIVGSNGAGKSSLVYQLSPLPAEKDQFKKNGYKRIVILHNGKTYDLISDLGAEHPHHFIVDGVNLNDGGTVTVQKDLVKSHFGYDNTVHEIIHGLKNFTAMSTGERKFWFTFLADADYDYAIKVFQKVKERLNDMQSALKLAKQRLVIESSKVISDEEYKRLKEETEVLYTSVQFLVDHREKPTGTTDDYLRRGRAMHEQIKVVCEEIHKRVRYANKHRLGTAEELAAKKEQMRDEHTSLVAQSTHFYEEYEHLNKLWETWKASKLESIANIDQEITSAQTEIGTHRRMLNFSFEPKESAQAALESCTQMEQWWPTIQDQLHDNRIHQFNRESFTQLNHEIALAQQRITELSVSKERSQATADHQKSHASDAPLQCPKCSHHFSITFDPAKLAQAQQAVAQKQSEIETQRAHLQSLQAKSAEMQAYFQTYRLAVTTFKAAPGMEPLLNFLIQEEVIQNQPDQVTTMIRKYKDDNARRVAIQRNEERIAAARTLLEQTEGQDMSATDIQARRDRAERQVSECEQRKRALVLEIDSTDKHLRVLSSLQDMATQLKTLETNVHQLTEEAVENVRRIEYGNLLREMHSLLSTKETALQASDRQLSVINHITEQIHELTDQIELFKILVKELSPTEGLIAEGIFSFMRKFVGDMNRLIKLVWTYPLEVRPCALEKEGSLTLNYKFPIMVDKATSTRKDVSEGSSAMIEIFNLVFRLAAMKAMGLGKFPLVLDEFGRGFDALHRQSIVPLLGTLIDLDQVDQIFMISHEFSQYTSLGRSEICVLHAANIVLPPGVVFNKHVTMTKETA